MTKIRSSVTKRLPMAGCNFVALDIFLISLLYKLPDLTLTPLVFSIEALVFSL